ncbi:pectin lyase fold/virulence factor, partial [Emericellopsis atlantica]
QCLASAGNGGDSDPAPAPEDAEEDTPEPSASPAESNATSAPASTSAASNECGAAAVDELVGYGDGTTGGGSGSGTTVTSCSELESALKAGGVINVEGTITGCGSLHVGSDTSLIGVGNAGFVDTGFRMVDVTNVIVRNLELHNPPEGADLIDIESSTYIWVDHCSLSSAGITGDKDFYDGLLDMKRASDFVTVSWCRFEDHWKASLIGHSASNGDQDSGTLHVTYHHNYWNNINSRCPSVRFGTAHIYSSCYENIPASGINSRENAQVLVENTAFNSVRRAIVTDLDANDPGFAVERDNIFNDSNTDITQEGSLDVPYEYVSDPADCICDLLRTGAGAGVL